MSCKESEASNNTDNVIRTVEVINHMNEILKTKTQRKFVDPCCHDHSNAHKPSKLLRPDFEKCFEIF